jgi:nucleotide-binding universal stress UspA family protein/hemerythrin-like domain-containing protein
VYKHLLVPVDDTQLSAANVTSAVDLASKLRAHITFFHAAKDFAATNDGALLKVIAPQIYAEEAVGDTNVLLSKAATVAAAMRVSHDTVAAVSDHPAEAIVEAARRRGCDLIVMASRGTRGAVRWLHTSQTQHVLQQSEIPVLVTRGAGAEPFTACDRALAIIQDEHRSIAVVVQGLQEWVKRTRQPLSNADLESLDLMLGYLLSFPLQQHHPKEERHLHQRLRERVPDSDPLLNEIELEHTEHAAMIDALVALLREVQSGRGVRTDQLLSDVQTLADAAWQHIRNEESTVLPLARARLLDDDWVEIAAAFEGPGTSESRAQAATSFRDLFARIANRNSAARTAA